MDHTQDQLMDAQHMARVARDHRSFAYVETLPPQSSRHFRQDFYSGTTSVDADLTIQPKTRGVPMVRALLNTSTSGITVSSHDPMPIP